MQPQISAVPAALAPMLGGNSLPSACTSAPIRDLCARRQFGMPGEPRKCGYRKYSNAVEGKSLQQSIPSCQPADFLQNVRRHTFTSVYEPPNGMS